MISLAVTILGITKVLETSLFRGSAKAAQDFLLFKRDPLRLIKRHFHAALRWIKQPIAVFIDDIDRCDSRYVVQLIEGIQTIFSDSRLVYIVAGDRRWLHTAFETEYKVFSDAVPMPGRHIGDLFLEKTFQMSVVLPKLSSEVGRQYWSHLLGQGDPNKQQSEVDVSDKANKKAKRFLYDQNTEDAIMSVIADADKENDPVLSKPNTEHCHRKNADTANR